MSFLQLPLTTDTDAPLPSGVGYDVSQEQHAGCPRGGWLAVEIEPMTGASVECCTACRHRRVISMTTATAEALRARAEAEEAAVEAATPAPDPVATPRHCACECGAVLGPLQTRYASLACRRRHETMARAGRRTVCACGCGKKLTRSQTMYASARCRKDSEIRRGIAYRSKRAALAAEQRPTVPCVGCQAPVPRSPHARRESIPRCAPCQRAADQQRLDAYWAAQRGEAA